MPNLIAPNGKLIIATADFVPGNAQIADVTRKPDGSLEIDFAGETELCWNGQYTATTRRKINGKWKSVDLYVDEDGNQWPENELKLEGEA